LILEGIFVFVIEEMHLKSFREFEVFLIGIAVESHRLLIFDNITNDI